MSFYMIKNNNNKWLKIYKDYDRENKIKYVEKKEDATIIGEQMLKIIVNRKFLETTEYSVIKIDK